MNAEQRRQPVSKNRDNFAALVTFAIAGGLTPP